MRPWYRVIIKLTRAAFLFLPVQSIGYVGVWRLSETMQQSENEAWKIAVLRVLPPRQQKENKHSEINIHTFPVWEWAPPWSEWCKQIPDLFVIGGCGFVTSNLLFSMKWGGRLQTRECDEDKLDLDEGPQRRTAHKHLATRYTKASPRNQLKCRSSHPQSCLLDLSCRAMPLSPVQILWEVEVIHRAAEFTIAGAVEAPRYATLSVWSTYIFSLFHLS